MLKIYTDAQRKTAGLVTTDDVLKSCRAAAKLALQGDAWSLEDRADCAAHLTTLVLERAALDAESVLNGKGQTVLLNGGRGNLYPARLIGLDFLVKRGGDWRRAREAERARDEVEAAATGGGMAVHGSSMAPDAPSELRDAAPHTARRAALDMLQNAGLIGRRVEDAPAYLWTLAYASARASAGLESREIADELEMTFGTLRNHLSRAAKALRSGGHDMRAWVPALALEGHGWSRPGEYTAPKDRTRLAPADHAPITTRKTRTRTSAPGADWSAPRKWNGWTIDPLTPGTRARLEKATRMRRQRADAKTPDERRRARLAAGLDA